jgi:hypothetical protein
MPRTTRTTRARKSAEQEPAAALTKREAASGEATSGEQDPAAVLTAAYTQAIDARDQATGVIPAVEVDAVRLAYGQVPKRQRGNLVARLAGEAGKNVTTADGQVDTGLAVAVATLSGLFAQVNEQERPTPPPHDPVPAVAGVLAALDQARAEILEELSDEQRERVALAETLADPAAKAASEATLAAVQKQSARAFNGRSRPRNGTRAPARVVGEKIQAVVKESKEPLTLSELAEQTGVSPATLWSRWTSDNTPGVVAFQDDQGRKAFRAA